MNALKRWWRGLFELAEPVPLDQIERCWTQIEADEQNRWGQHGA